MFCISYKHLCDVETLFVNTFDINPWKSVNCGLNIIKFSQFLIHLICDDYEFSKIFKHMT